MTKLGDVTPVMDLRERIRLVVADVRASMPTTATATAPASAARQAPPPTPLVAATWKDLLAALERGPAPSPAGHGAAPPAPRIDDLFEGEGLAKLEAELPPRDAPGTTTLDPGAFARLAASTRRQVVDVLVEPLDLGGLLEPPPPEQAAVVHDLADGLRLAFDAEETSAAPRAPAPRTATPYGQKLAAPATPAPSDPKAPAPAVLAPSEPDAAAPAAPAAPRPAAPVIAPGVMVANRKAILEGSAQLFDAYAPERAPVRQPSLDATTAFARRSATAPLLRFFASPEGQTELEAELVILRARAESAERAPTKLREDEDARPPGNRPAAWNEEAAMRARVEAELARRAWSPEGAVPGRGRSSSRRRGWQQAFGCVLVELVDGLFDEAVDLCERRRRHRDVESVCAELTRRARAVGERVFRRWRPALDALVDGTLETIIATVLAAIVDAFVRTGRCAVRLLRDGLPSFWRAVRVLATPRPGVDGAREASKLLLDGLVTAGGVPVEVSVEDAFASSLVLAPLGPLVDSTVVATSASLVGLVFLTLVDRADLFGTIARSRGDAQRRVVLRRCVRQILDELLGPTAHSW